MNEDASPFGSCMVENPSVETTQSGATSAPKFLKNLISFPFLKKTS